MLANNVQETTVSTGVGSIALSGASEGGRTFFSQYPVNSRFTYFIDDGAGVFETGIGYLSSSSVLVRDIPQDGSSSLPVNFLAGTKQVFIGSSMRTVINNADGFNNIGGASKVCKPENVINGTNRNTTANSIVYIPSLFSRGFSADLIGVLVSSAPLSGSMYAGIYDIDPSTGLPGNLLVESTTLNPSSTGLITGTIPTFHVCPGWHYLALWTDVSVPLRSSSGQNLISNPFHLGSSSGLSNVIYQSASGISSLPAVAAPTTASLGGSSFNYVVLGKS